MRALVGAGISSHKSWRRRRVDSLVGEPGGTPEHLAMQVASLSEEVESAAERIWQSRSLLRNSSAGVRRSAMKLDLELLALHFKHQAHSTALDLRNISAWADEERGIVVHIIWHRNTRPPSTRVIVSIPALEDYARSTPEHRAVADLRFRHWLLATLGEVRSTEGEEIVEGILEEYVVGSRELNG